MKIEITLLLCLAFIAGCAAAPYKQADLSDYGGRQGYLDKQIGENMYILEYSHIGGYNYNLELNKQYWEKRAMQLCSNGYEGEYEVVHPAYAKIDEFVCPQNFCRQYSLVSGVIKCK